MIYYGNYGNIVIMAVPVIIIIITTYYDYSPVVIVLLVGGWPTPLKNMSSSVGMMTFPIYGKK